MKKLALLLLFPLALFSQTGGLSIVNGVIDFSGAASRTRPTRTGAALPGTCSVLDMFGRTSDNTLHFCGPANTWNQLGVSGAGSSFSAITNGTNTTATMTVGTGSTLTFSGSGVNNANQFKGNATVAVADGGTGLTTAFARTAFITAAECSNATAAPAWDLPTSNAPTATCFGTSYRFGALAYADSANQTGSFYFPLPAGWTGAIDFTGYAFVNATSQSVKLTVATVCVAASEDILNPTFNSAQTVTVTSPGTANQLFTFTQASMTTTGCAAGENLILKVGRDTTDTSTADLNVTGVQLVIRVTPQA